MEKSPEIKVNMDKYYQAQNSINQARTIIGVALNSNSSLPIPAERQYNFLWAIDSILAQSEMLIETMA